MELICAHCLWKYDPDDPRWANQTPYDHPPIHDYPKPGRAVCQGCRQKPLDTLQPAGEVGPPVRCSRCKALAECAVPFSGTSPDSTGKQIVVDGKICTSCWDVSQRSLAEFFDGFVNTQPNNED